MVSTLTESIEREEGSNGYYCPLVLQEKEFQTKHQLLVWRQYATIEHHWNKIHQVDLAQNRLLVEKLNETTGHSTNGKVVNIVTRSAIGRGGMKK